MKKPKGQRRAERQARSKANLQRQRTIEARRSKIGRQQAVHLAPLAPLMGLLVGAAHADAIRRYFT